LIFDHTHLRRLAWRISLAALTLVVWKIIEQHQAFSAWRPSPAQWLGLLGFALVYGVGGFLLSTAWGLILSYLGVSQIRQRQVHRIYGTSQIAKYLPGNLFHIVGRHVAGRSLGIGHWELTASTVLELTSLTTSGLLIALVTVSAIWERLRISSGVTRWGLAPAIALALSAAPIIAWRQIYRSRLPGGDWSCLLGDLVFFGLSQPMRSRGTM
jgi:hypothetical protein